jgi:cytoskeletal protein RodZ
MSQLSGEELKEIRESKGVSLEKAAADLCLRPELLRALENSTGSEFLSDTYHRLSLQMYARYLGRTLPGTRPLKSAAREVSLSPVNSCVELAYSDKLDPKVSKPKRRSLRAGAILAAAAIVVLAVGIWSLNAKLARLTPGPKQTVVEAAPTETPTVPDVEPATATDHTDSITLPAEHVTLDEELYFSLTPPEPPPEIIWH